jgi:hypothetical protein
MALSLPPPCLAEVRSYLRSNCLPAYLLARLPRYAVASVSPYGASPLAYSSRYAWPISSRALGELGHAEGRLMRCLATTFNGQLDSITHRPPSVSSLLPTLATVACRLLPRPASLLHWTPPSTVMLPPSRR